MPYDYSGIINSAKAYIFRIVHRDVVPWILDNGLHCKNSPVQAPNYVNIGNAELIDKRSRRVVPYPPGGSLSDYVPFYFTPFSPMMLNIRSGRGGVTKRSNDEIVILVSSLRHIEELGLPFMFTNGHALPEWVDYFRDLANLPAIDWSILQRRDFSRDPEDPRKMERYQAEALVHQHLPVAALIGVVCFTEQIKLQLEEQVQARGLSLKILAKRGWYFS